MQLESNDLYERAKLFTKEAGVVSVSSLQRKLLIGHKQAEQLLLQLIDENICEPTKSFVQDYGHGYKLNRGIN